MTYYLVRARPKPNLLRELRRELDAGRFIGLRPFGRALTASLEGARWEAQSGMALWEEEDYCSLPLAQERQAVLDKYFDELQVEPVARNEGRRQIRHLPSLWNTVREPNCCAHLGQKLGLWPRFQAGDVPPHRYCGCATSGSSELCKGWPLTPGQQLAAMGFLRNLPCSFDPTLRENGRRAGTDEPWPPPTGYHWQTVAV